MACVHGPPRGRLSVASVHGLRPGDADRRAETRECRSRGASRPTATWTAALEISGGERAVG